MEKQIRVAFRISPRIVKQIERVAKAQGSTLSQFLRTAAIKELNEVKKVAA